MTYVALGFRETPQAALDTADLIVTTRPRFNLEYFALYRSINYRKRLSFSFMKVFIAYIYTS